MVYELHDNPCLCYFVKIGLTKTADTSLHANPRRTSIIINSYYEVKRLGWKVALEHQDLRPRATAPSRRDWSLLNST